MRTRLRRRCLAALVALAVVLVVFALPHPARASAGMLAPPHSDAGLDTDVPADGLFDYLVITANVDVTGAGGFVVMVILNDLTGMTQIAQGQKAVNLQAGPSAVEVRLSGGAIRQVGIDGPYQAVILLMNDTFSMLDMGVHLTAAYLATQFDLAPASLAPPHADAGVDTDGDLRFDYLAVDVSLNITDAGAYTVTGELLDVPRTVRISSASNTTFMPAGARQNVRLRFGGTDIRAAGLNSPYLADLTLSTVYGQQLDAATHALTGTYFLSDFEPLGASFAPPHESFVVDLDGDGFWDYLVVNAVVSVTEPGFYTVGMDIPSVPLSSTTRAYLPAGTQVVQVDFLGFDIFTAGVDGAYDVDLTLRDEMSRVLDVDAHRTATYFAIDFEPSPLARWVPPTTDSGRDDQPDGFWDYLVIDATLDVSRRGSYDWNLNVYDSAFGTNIGGVGGSAELATGLNPIRMLFPGIALAMSGIDGPYGVELIIYDSQVRVLDTVRFMTGAYLASAFEGVPGQLAPPYTDVGIDVSVPPDGVYEMIAVDVPVTVTRAGTFGLMGALLDASLLTNVFDQRFADLAPGLNVVRLTFPTMDLLKAGQEGAFFGFLQLSVMKGDNSYPIGTDMFFTRNYTRPEVDQGPVVRLSGVTRAVESGTPLEAQNVVVVSPATRLQRSMTTDVSGYYETWLPRGQYLVIADSDSRNAAGAAVTLSTNTVMDFMLDMPPPQTMAGTVSFSGWNDATLRGDMAMGADAIILRLQFDMIFGDGDGVASQAELDRLLTFANVPELAFSTRDMFLVDDTAYLRVNGTQSFTLAGAGPVISQAPITATITADYVSSAPIALRPFHRALFLATYDTFTDTQTFSLAWPANYVLAAYDNVPAVAVTGVGGLSAVIDPFADPNPRDFVTEVWVNLTVSTTDASPPLVTGVELDGQPTLRTRSGPTLSVTATVTDTAWAIGGANYTIGPQNWPSSTPMAAQDGSFDGLMEPVTGTLLTAGMGEGPHQVCVYAWDIVPNNNVTGSCANLVIDDSPPTVTNVRVDGQTTRTVVVGRSVTLTATASDAATGNSAIASANYTQGAANWATSAVMAAADGAFNEPVEDLTATVSTTGWTAGTYDLCVYATDEVGNTDTTVPMCAQLIVLDQDLTRPAITDPRASPNPANVSVVVNLSAVVTDNVGVDVVYIEVFDAAGTSVANLTASYDASAGRYYVNRAFDAGGAYTFKVSARDTSGNWAAATGTFTVRTPQTGGPSLMDLWWVFLIVIVAAVAIAAVLLWSRRKKRQPAMGPAPAAAVAPPAAPPPMQPETPPPPVADPIDSPPPPPPPPP